MHIQNNFNQRVISTGLVPKKDYNGIILKLTKEDKKRINELIHEKSLAELEIERVKSIYSNYKVHSADGTWYEDTVIQIQLRIDEIKESIQQIKKNRFMQQQLNSAKKHNKLDTSM